MRYSGADFDKAMSFDVNKDGSLDGTEFGNVERAVYPEEWEALSHSPILYQLYVQVSLQYLSLFVSLSLFL